MAVILGVDPSLTNTGLCRLGFPGRPLDTGLITPRTKGYSRIIEIRNKIQKVLGGTDLVVIEGYSFGSQGRSFIDLAELGGVLRIMFTDQGFRWTEVAPSTAKKFCTGHGNAKKENILVDVLKRWGVEMPTSHQADAFVLAKVGEALLNDEAGVEQQLNLKQQEVIRAIRYGKGK